jgi:hypothetical protein
VSSGTAKFLFGLAIGAGAGFTAGYFTATPTARSASSTALGGILVSAKFVGRTISRASDGIGASLESAYTRIRGREEYLEHQIEELREQIIRLEQRVD